MNTIPNVKYATIIPYLLNFPVQSGALLCLLMGGNEWFEILVCFAQIAVLK